MRWLRCSVLWAFVAMSAALSGPAFSDVSEPAATLAGKAYSEAAERGGVTHRITYMDPGESIEHIVSSGNSTSRAAKPASQEAELPAFRRLVLAVSIGIALCCVAFIAFGGSRVKISLGRRPDQDEAASEHQNTRNTPVALPDLESILAIPDRSAALVMLCQAGLAKALNGQGILPQRSWTARETLHHLPRQYPHRGALQSLVFASEQAQFGGREVSDEEFASHVGQVRRVWEAVV